MHVFVLAIVSIKLIHYFGFFGGCSRMWGEGGQEGS